MTTERTELVLSGLQPDNLLAFLALLGTLRSLDEAEPDWYGRARWTQTHGPTRPALIVERAASREQVTDAIVRGLNALAANHRFNGRKDLKFEHDEAVTLLERAGDHGGYEADLWAALLTDGATSASDGTAEAERTPLCCQFGSGHQHFLERLKDVAQQKTADKAATTTDERNGKPNGEDDHQGPRWSGDTHDDRNTTTGKRKTGKTGGHEHDYITKALFDKWTRSDKTDGFRWDHMEERPYALRWADPSGGRRDNKIQTEHGANRLAAVGLTCMTVVPVRHGGRVRARTISGGTDRNGNATITWPIWSEPASLPTIAALMNHRGLLTDAEAGTRLGIIDLRCAHRHPSAKMMTFGRAEVVQL